NISVSIVDNENVNIKWDYIDHPVNDETVKFDIYLKTNGNNVQYINNLKHSIAKVSDTSYDITLPFNNNGIVYCAVRAVSLNNNYKQSDVANRYINRIITSSFSSPFG